MKKFLFLVMAILLMAGNQNAMMAQNATGKNKPRISKEEMIQRRTHQMVGTLMLDDQATTKFIPVYSQYLQERMDCMKMTLQRGEKGKALADMTDADAQTIIKNRFAQAHKLLDVQEKYYKEFRKILSDKQILKLYQQEKMMGNKMKKEMNERNKQRMGRRQNNGETTKADDNMNNSANENN